MDVETFPLIEIQNDLRILRLALEAFESRVSQLLSKQQEAVTDDHPKKFADLKGIWAGVALSYEEIKATECKIPDVASNLVSTVW